ncbi:hypothetical protein C8J57DRAFT_1522084 [Mycena rebaudengoi]|nr:hypothetical protein C8J57DRAFT_1522084 [Mycena rebaudengoi]
MHLGELRSRILHEFHPDHVLTLETLTLVIYPLGDPFPNLPPLRALRLLEFHFIGGGVSRIDGVVRSLHLQVPNVTVGDLKPSDPDMTCLSASIQQYLPA